MKTKLPLFPTIFTICAFVVLMILGTWQVKRLVWKNYTIEEISQRGEMPAIDLSKEWVNIDTMKYRKIAMKGHFLHNNEIHLFTGPREMRGDPGYNILTPFELKNGDVVLVDRGWVPATQKERSSRPETLVQGDISIVGMLQSGEHQGMFTPDNNIAKNLWFWLDMPAIAGFTGKQFDNVYVRALENSGAENGLPIAGKATVEIRNDHLQYAIIWYSLGIILLAIYTIYIKNNQSPMKGAKQRKRELKNGKL